LCGNGIRGRLLTALRLPAVLATAGAVVVAGLIARELGCDRRAQVFTAAAQATGLWSTLAGHWLTPYSLEPVQWMLLVWLLIRWQRVRDDRLLLVLGVVIGIAAMTKFQVMLLCLVLLVAIAVCGPRDLLGRPLLWAGAALAVLVAAPTLIWQYLHGWPQLRMTPSSRGRPRPCTGPHGHRRRLPRAALRAAGPDRLRPYFSDARRVADVGDDTHAFVLTGQQVPWTVLWPHLRTLRVS
jgi:hypothetical protein